MIDTVMTIGLDLAIGTVAYMTGLLQGVIKVRRRRPPPPDPTLSTICPSCGGAWSKWTAMKYDHDADRFEQTRQCPDCGRAQRRHVPRRETA